MLAPSKAAIKPYIMVPSMTVSTIGYEVRFPIELEVPVSSEMLVSITIAEEEIEPLETYSPLFKHLSLEPRRVPILPESSNFSFGVSFKEQIVPPPLTLRFELSSFYDISHNLTTPQKIMCFDLDDSYNVLYPPLRITLTDKLEYCNTGDVGRKFTNIMVDNTSSGSSAALIHPRIISITAQETGSTWANLSIFTRTPGTITYFYTDA